MFVDAPPLEAEVLVVGGGPVGLSAALELSHQGVPCALVEPRRQVARTRPRAKTSSVRTMEHFRRWGIADAIRAAAPLQLGEADTAVFCTSVLGYEVTRFEACFGLFDRHSEIAAEPGQQIPQYLVEEVLRDRLHGSSLASLALGWRATDVSEAEGGVVVNVASDTGTRRTITAEYLIAADGARGLVRSALGIGLELTRWRTSNFNLVFRCRALAAIAPHPRALHYWIMNPAAAGVVGPLHPPDDTWWCGLRDTSAEAGRERGTQLVHALLGRDLDLEILCEDPWTAQMGIADDYRSPGGRAFLVGDAAHQNSPHGGHGYNTGVGDAVNLGWKLAATLRGWGGDALLDSYPAERRPIQARTISDATANMSADPDAFVDPEMLDGGPRGAEARARAASAIQAAKRAEFHSLGLVLGYRYDGSPIIVDDGAPPPPEDAIAYIPSAKPGGRLPHRWLAPGRSLYDVLGRGFTLLCPPRDPRRARFAAAARERNMPLTVLELDTGYLEASLVLVRPDQHVAWRGDECQDPGVVLDVARGGS